MRLELSKLPWCFNRSVSRELCCVMILPPAPQWLGQHPLLLLYVGAYPNSTGTAAMQDPNSLDAALLPPLVASFQPAKAPNGSQRALSGPVDGAPAAPERASAEAQSPSTAGDLLGHRSLPPPASGGAPGEDEVGEVDSALGRRCQMNCFHPHQPRLHACACRRCVAMACPRRGWSV